MQNCKGKKKTGAECRAPAGSGGLCFFHANPASAKMLGQRGGRKNRRSMVDLEVPDTLTTAGLLSVQRQAMHLLLAGEMGAREAIALAHLCNSALRAVPTADIEGRIAMLEEQLAQQESGTSESGPTASPTEAIRKETELLEEVDEPALDSTDTITELTLEADGMNDESDQAREAESIRSNEEEEEEA